MIGGSGSVIDTQSNWERKEKKTRKYNERSDVIIMPYKGTIHLLVVHSNVQRGTTTKMYFIRL